LNRAPATSNLTIEPMAHHAHQVVTELLVLRAQGGHADAVDLLVRTWQERLLRHARRMTGRDDAGLDVMQEAWVSILRGIAGLEDPARFGPWAFQIVTRQSAQWVRQQQRQRKIEDDLAPAKESTVDRSGASDDVDEVRVALQRLPAEQRSILELRYADDFSIGEIAEALSLAAGTVKSRLFHARELLREILERIRT
jgi:RNA polymerase sigma factor (sigma-70 family)